MSQNFGLGRGLASLIPPKSKISKPQDDFNYFGAKVNPEESGKKDPLLLTEGQKVEEVEIFKIMANPHQPRKDFNAEKLQELADSIKKNGIIQPILVTARGGRLEIIAGERRLKAAKLAGLTKVPVIIREANEQQKLELAIIENIQRHDLNPIEEADSYQKLSQEFGLSQEEVAEKVGKSRLIFSRRDVERVTDDSVDLNRELFQGGRQVGQVGVKPNGRWTIPNLLPGRYAVRAYTGSGYTDMQDVELLEGEVRTLGFVFNPLPEEAVFAFPNPARTATTIRFMTDLAPLEADINIFDLAGNLVREFPGSAIVAMPGSRYHVVWDLNNSRGQAVASGVYLVMVKIKGGSDSQTAKVIKKVAVVR